jgi:hypothetical protein
MSRPLRVAIAGRFYWHNGSSHALLGYARAAERLGIDARASLLGIVDETVQQKVSTASADWNADLLVLVCEELFLRQDARQQLEALYPRSRRVLIDPDGRYSPLTNIGIDANHATEEARAEWVTEFESLADKIVQPSLGASAPGTHSFLYFGVDNHRTRHGTDPRKAYDLIYVGNNWHRWRDITWLVESLAPVRAAVERIAVFGQWWTGETVAGCEAEIFSDPHFLRENGVETHPPVPFDDVELTMARGRISPVLVRPILNALHLATPRMFETFVAGTVPILPPYFAHAPDLYGDRVRPLQLPAAPAETILGILTQYESFVELTREVADMLGRDHSYEKRWSQLLDIGLA